MENKNEKYIEQFRHLLRYFVVHLEYCYNESIGQITDWSDAEKKYKEYIVKKAGQGYNGGEIQKQINEWCNYPVGKVCISVSARNGYNTKASYLHWDGTGLNINAEWNEKKIEKTFVEDDENLGNKIKKLINQIPEGIFELTDEIVTQAIVELNVELDKQIYVSLADHIAFAIKRFKNGITIKNELLSEIRRVHKKEFIFSLWAVDYINKKLYVNLPEDEAGFISLHFVNASYNETTTKSVESTKVIKDILNIIKYYFSIELDEEDLNYDRLLTHLKYFLGYLPAAKNASFHQSAI